MFNKNNLKISEVPVFQAPLDSWESIMADTLKESCEMLFSRFFVDVFFSD